MLQQKNAKNVKCPKCYRLLCKRIPVTLEGDEGWLVHVKHRGMELYMYDATITCPACRSRVRVNGAEGIIGRQTNTYAGN
jgi:hypothetical protein